MTRTVNVNISDFRNPQTIRKLGIDALVKELGPVGMAYFIRQFESGEGDYTAERGELFKNLTMDEVMGELEFMRKAESVSK